jgi:hypothetical protein
MTTSLMANDPRYIAANYAMKQSNKLANKAISNVFDTEILVVIGYSFPFFNRNIDRRIIQSMTNLKKIYLQSPEAMSLKDRLNAVINLEKIEVVPIKDTDQFILPYEL